MDVQPSTDTNPSAPSRSSRRMALSLALGAALGGIGMPVGRAVAKPKRTPRPGSMPKSGGRRQPKHRRQRRPRFKVVTRTFASAVPITILDEGTATPYPSIIQVGALRAGSIVDVNVTLRDLTYRIPKRLDVVLVGPNGRTAVGLMNKVGGNDEVTDVTLVFDDQAPGWLPYDAQIVSGSFKPTLPGAAPRPEAASLRAFTGLNPNGTWRLYVASDVLEAGSIDGWALTIKARVRV